MDAMDDCDAPLPRVLVVSNNCFSTTTNNGKTLASLFRGYPADKITQMYFSSEQPDFSGCSDYFRLSDRDVLKSLIPRNDRAGARVVATSGSSSKTPRFRRHSSTRRLIREAMWAVGSWRSARLDLWVKAARPDLILFHAGDSLFAYHLVEDIRRLTAAPLLTFITDDYILPRPTVSAAWWVRRCLIKKHLGYAIDESRALMTISEPMREEYLRLFGRDSRVLMNSPEPPAGPETRASGDSREDYDYPLVFVYAGGLHLGRDKVLQVVARCIAQMNQEAGRPLARLHIYSAQNLGPRTVKRLAVPGSSEFRGSLGEANLDAVLASADVLLHVESFSRAHRAATRLCVSTKIPEYLSHGHAIFAVGPSNIASIKLLEGIAEVATRPGGIATCLRRIVSDSGLRATLGARARELFLDEFSSTENQALFRRELLQAARRGGEA